MILKELNVSFSMQKSISLVLPLLDEWALHVHVEDTFIEFQIKKQRGYKIWIRYKHPADSMLWRSINLNKIKNPEEMYNVLKTTLTELLCDLYL